MNKTFTFDEAVEAAKKGTLPVDFDQWGFKDDFGVTVQDVFNEAREDELKANRLS